MIVQKKPADLEDKSAGFLYFIWSLKNLFEQFVKAIVEIL